ncbi:MAG TPA: PSD1 and planctomycete cytochrome C domain-containing protein [Pirellulales bacterium]|jgi:hypothetical protein|nr:PSD1 and planctomycete cytochrome C domain-containing protein [Pirellulales bacterium]
MPRLAWLQLAVTAFVGLARPAPAAEIDFAHDIVPILQKHCATCHTNGTYKGSFSLDTREAMLESEAVTPGKPADSELVSRIRSSDPDERMPPADQPALKPADIATLERWIASGAKWDEGFTFKRAGYVAPLLPRRPTLPPARAGLEHPIDRILDAYFARHKVAWPAPLDDAAWMRRMYLDVIGLLPQPEEIDAFAANPASEKHALAVAGVLADRRAYADHWMTFWNDLLRNDYSGIGFREDGRHQITDWLYQSLVDNKPYDQFVRELIAPTEESKGFIHGIQWRGRVNASQTREIQFSQNVSQVFFGINMKCASCHDSFIDRWKLDDAYALAAINAEKPLEIYRCDKATDTTATARFLWPELGTIDPALPRAERLAQLAKLITHPDNGRFQRTIVNRIWQRMFGRGIVHPVDVMAGEPWSADLLDYLARYLVDNGYDLKKLIEHIATSRIYRSQAATFDELPGGDDYVFHGAELKRMTAEQFIDAIYTITGTQAAKLGAKLKPPQASRRERALTRSGLTTLDLLQRSLGRPNREQIVTTRADQLTTLEALDLSNGTPLVDLLNRGAAALLKEHAKLDSEAIARRVFRSALSREPTSEEQTTLVEIVGRQPAAESVADLLWTIVMLPEFQLIR